MIRIEEGPPVIIQSVDFFGFDVLPATTINFLRRTLTLKAGEVRRQGDLVAARNRAQLMLNERGYPYARVQALEGSGRETEHRDDHARGGARASGEVRARRDHAAIRASARN